MSAIKKMVVILFGIFMFFSGSLLAQDCSVWMEVVSRLQRENADLKARIAALEAAPRATPLERQLESTLRSQQIEGIQDSFYRSRVRPVYVPPIINPNPTGLYFTTCTPQYAGFLNCVSH